MTNSEFELCFFFIEEQHRNVKKQITMDTRLEADLGITGDDGFEFMEAFFKKFRIEYSDFETDRYFNPEAFDIPFLTDLLRKLVGSPKLKRFEIYDITVGDLEKTLKKGRWTDPLQRDQG